MPLHLLGKKSWNVYNTANVERVRRDEAAAAAKEAAEEQRMQEEDAENRIRRLRGLSPLKSTQAAVESEEIAQRESGEKQRHAHDRKRRKLRGEDDTDRDIRYAKEAQISKAAPRPKQDPSTQVNAPLTDQNGHIALFGPDLKGASPPDTTEHKAAKKSDQQKSRATKDGNFKEMVGENPWYSLKGNNELQLHRNTGRDVWGNEDPQRQERDVARLASSDPLMAIKRGVQGVRKVEKEKRRWQEEKRREITEIERDERLKERRRRHRDHRTHHRRRAGDKAAEKDEIESLEGFRLDDVDSKGSRSNMDGRPERRRHREHGEKLQ